LDSKYIVYCSELDYYFGNSLKAWGFFFTTALTTTPKMDAFNPLNAELNPICHLLALLGAHHILHVSRIRVNSSVGKRDDGIENSLPVGPLKKATAYLFSYEA